MTFISQTDPHLWVAILEHLDAQYWLRPEQISEVARRGFANRKKGISPDVPASGRDREQWTGTVDLACYCLLRRDFAELGPGPAWRITPAGAEWLRRFGGVRRNRPTPSQARQSAEQVAAGQPSGPAQRQSLGPSNVRFRPPTSKPSLTPVNPVQSAQPTAPAAGMRAPVDAGIHAPVDAGTHQQQPSVAPPAAPPAASPPPPRRPGRPPRSTAGRATTGSRVRTLPGLLGAMQRRHIARAAAQTDHSRVGIIDRYLLAVAAHELELYAEAMALIDTALAAGLDGEFADRAQQLRSVCAAKAFEAAPVSGWTGVPGR